MMYLVFAGWPYESRLGWNDFIGGCKSIEEAQILVRETVDRWQWWQIVDVNSLQIVEAGEGI